MSAAPENPDVMGGADLQVWNNAAFDDGGDSGGSASVKKVSPAWYPLRPIPAVRPSESLFHGKENRSQGLPGRSPVPKKTPAPAGKSFPLTPIPAKQPASARKAVGFGGDGAEDGDIDAEIKGVETEIGRLTLRLEGLRLLKAEKDSRTAGRRGRIVPAKFLEPKTSSEKNDQVEAPASRKVQESPATAKLGRRGASLGPLEIITGVGFRHPGKPGTTPVRSVQDRRKSCIFKLQGVAEEDGEGEKKSLGPKQATPVIGSRRTTDPPAIAPPSAEFLRGASLGPSEIAAAVGSRRPGKNLQDIKEEEEAFPKKGSRRSLSSSPKSRKPAAKLPELRKGVATVESKKPAGRENPAAAAAKNLRPKTLFQEAKKPAKADKTAPKSLQHRIPKQEVKKLAPIKKPGKNAKMKTVASRYSLITVRVGRNAREGKRRKWSLPDGGKDDEEPAAIDAKKSRMSMPVAGHTLAMGSQGGLQWEIPDRIDEEADSIERSPPSLMRFARALPKIRTIRCDAGSPRDSGRAKRVAELMMGGESHFDAVVVEVEEEGTADAPCESMELGEDEQ